MNMNTETIGSQPSWFVGASYGGTDDQMSRFLAEGIWENGYEDKYLEWCDRCGQAIGSR